MDQFHIRKVDTWTAAMIRQTAAAEGRSLNAQVKVLLSEAALARSIRANEEQQQRATAKGNGAKVAP